MPTSLFNRFQPGANRRSPSSPPPSGGTRGGWEGLYDYVGQYFIPELERLRGKRGGIEDAFLSQATTPGALYGAASEAAGGVARQLFAPGGEVASLVGRARGGAIQRGFNPESSVGAEDEILRGATQRVSDTFATHAAGLEQARFGGLAGLYGDTQSGIRDLIESIYTGGAGAEQLRLAMRGQAQNERGFFSRLFG